MCFAWFRVFYFNFLFWFGFMFVFQLFISIFHLGNRDERCGTMNEGVESVLGPLDHDLHRYLHYLQTQVGCVFCVRFGFI